MLSPTKISIEFSWHEAGSFPLVYWVMNADWVAYLYALSNLIRYVPGRKKDLCLSEDELPGLGG
jgi:hypothetical protein